MADISIKKVRKRDGRLADFDQEKITEAIWKAAQAVGGKDRKTAEKLSDLVVTQLEKAFKNKFPSVENIQDIVEKILIEEGHAKTAKAYIIYREKHDEMREVKQLLLDSQEIVRDYIAKEDWRVYENANITYNFSGLLWHAAGTVMAYYGLNYLYPKEIADAHINGDLHLHNLSMSLAGYCAGWSLRQLLHEGFNGVPGRIECSPPKHLRSAVGQMINFIGTLQNEWAGAQAFSSFDTYLAPLVRADKLSYKETKQAIQEFVYNMNVASRWGGQSPFTNITLDLVPPDDLREQAVTIGGKLQNSTYGDYQEEIDMINKAFIEVMTEGDAKARVFTFPIPTYNITKDFNWNSEVADKLFEMTAKYGLPYFQNFVSSDLKPSDVRSMCCHLRLDLTELRKNTTGGLFGSGESTGSVGVVTINMPRIGFLSKTEEQFFERLDRYMYLAMRSLEIKRKIVQRNIDTWLLPYTRRYLGTLNNHFSTIGIVGMNEACLNFLGKDIASKEGHDFAIRTLNFMREKLTDYQKETGHLYNLEATPAEGTSYRLAKKDKQLYLDIKTQGEKEPYYTNATSLPVDYTDDLLFALKHQEPLQTLYTGGCIEKGNKVLTDKGLLDIEHIVRNFEKLKPIKVLSYNPHKNISEWDEVIDAMAINVEEKDKIRILGERNLDITTSDWHPFFTMEKIKVNPACPVCRERVKNVRAFAAHLRFNKKCREKYKTAPKFKIVEKRADNLKIKDYILQNSNNLLPKKKTELNDDLMWLIGFFIGDGSISQIIDNRSGNMIKKYVARFFSEHKEALEKARGILSKYFKAEVKIIQKDKRSKKLLELASSKQSVWGFFFKYGFRSGKKVYNVFLPKEVKDNLNKNNVYSLLSGLADSDGHIGKRNGDFEYSTVSPQLADDILEICSLAGIMIAKKEKPTKRRNEVNIYRLIIPNYQMTRIKGKLKVSVNPSRIKDSLSNRKTRYFPVIRVKEVSKINTEDNQFYDLTTRKNHNYLAGRNSLVFIHNTVLHVFLGESIQGNQARLLVKKISEKSTLPYFTLSPTFSICSEHGYLKDKQEVCPKCGKETEVYSRVVGYLRPVRDWNLGKQEEWKDRKVFAVEKAVK